MEELLKMAYRNFLNTEDETDSERIRILAKSCENTDKALGKLRDILSDKLFDEIYDLITDGDSDMREAAFIYGFSYCAKFLTNGKTDFLTDMGKGGGQA